MYADYFRIFVAFEETFEILKYEVLIRLGIPFLLQAEAFDWWFPFGHVLHKVLAWQLRILLALEDLRLDAFCFLVGG